METSLNKNTDCRIILTLLNGTGYVFNVDDYMELRSKHRIVGSLMGTCSTRGWSASESMLPVELSVYETKLLVDERIALLVSKETSLLGIPSATQLCKYKQNFEQQISAQREALKAEKLRETERNICKVLEGKRRKLLAAGVKAEDIKLNASTVLKEIGENIAFDRNNALLEIHCGHPTTHTATIVQMPHDNSLKYCVFRDLWQKGKFVTCGEAFGADFLLYPGDPMLYHASHIVILMQQPLLQPLDLIAKVRLSVIVNKICLLAYFAKTSIESETADCSDRQICYQSVNWEGNRDKEKLIKAELN